MSSPTSYSRQRRRHAAREGKRLDIQGLRMVAVLTVFATHLWGWPSGGFVGVDVFLVISGFLITGTLLRDAERTGTIRFGRFYWNRVRRIVPAATVVLLATYLASVLVFVPFRSEQVGVDSLFAFVFLANWHFAVQSTDYFAASETLSPIQHYWSLSIEEQFYFVWPALILLISIVVVRKTWDHDRRMQIAGVVMAGVIIASLGWSLHETAAAPTWAYFSTFSRVWELGIGALLACMIGAFGRIPAIVRPMLSWAGLALIAASLFLLSDTSTGFPAPWAMLPVAGAALVLAAGVGTEPRYQAFLRNPVAEYLGDISYSLYLVHWPVIVLIGSLMDGGVFFSVVVLATAFGLAILSYHLVENPLRRADRTKLHTAVSEFRNHRFELRPATSNAALGGLALIVVGLVTFSVRPDAYEHAPSLPIAAPADDEPFAEPELDPMITDLQNEPELGPSTTELQNEPELGPSTTELQNELAQALQATEWPTLDPSIESIFGDNTVRMPIGGACRETGPTTDPATCTFGSPDAPTRIVLVGNSVGLYYLDSLRAIAENSGGTIQVRTMALQGCNFAADTIFTPAAELVAACPDRNEAAVDYINQTRPDVVIVSNNYSNKQVVGSDRYLDAVEWRASLRGIIDRFSSSTEKVVMLAAPPGDVDLEECSVRRGSEPADCVGRVTELWLEMAQVDRDVAAAVDGTWIDARPWFCTPGNLCPAFAGTTPTKVDHNHLLPTYGRKIAPAINEAFVDAGVFEGAGTP